MAKKTPKQFLIEIATDAEKLGEFILDPEGAMDEAKIAKKERANIKHGIALYASRKLMKPLEAFDVTVVYVTGVEP